MSLNIPDNPAPTGYVPRPADYTSAIEKATLLLSELRASSEWEDAGEREEVKLTKIVDPADPYAVPTTRGETIVENATPAKVLAALMLPGIRKKWDPRLEEGYPIARFSQSSYELYSVMKSPSYFIWARDIAAVQESHWKDGNVEMIQVSVTDEENLPDAGSYAKSRTRATVDISGWNIEQDGDNVKLSYIVKVHLNGNIPTSVVSMLAQETPMCVGRVRDVFYQHGFVPYEVMSGHSKGEYPDHKVVSVTQVFEDGDGTEATAGARKWTGSYRGAEPDTIHIAYDGERMYKDGVNVTIGGEGASAVSSSVDEAKSIISVTVGAEAKDKDFTVTVEPK
ncbi:STEROIDOGENIC ACUTE REGULATORY PROTEIN (STAR) [Ceraceosorus bombacis]|uniref:STEROIDOGENIC ACUTE REGULATORY PROTEIN (STAR) n=1 Tax=Ceraceosorus bombacis TaxID=401625 RepID=A0A0P1BF38_9BASI|nr:STEROIDOGENIC ACUTE REGULATORY PROTEIN (STAR) [Ceraceosorus bombacis]